MKFRLKITLALVCLLSLLFGGGSSALISLSFQNALAREQAAAKASYYQLLHTFQLVERVEVWSQPQDAVQVVQQLSAQGGQSWAALSLTAGEDVLVTQGVPAQGFLDWWTPATAPRAPLPTTTNSICSSPASWTFRVAPCC